MTTSAPNAPPPGAQGDPNPSSAPASPGVDPDSWETFVIGSWTIKHPIAILVEFDGAALKTDDQKASGTDKAKIKVSGVENAKGAIKFQWTQASDDVMFAFMMDVDPNGPNKGKPLDVVHPEFTLNRVSQILPTQWKKLIRKGDWRERTLEIKEWTAPAAATAGATTTPKSAGAASGSTTVTGFGGIPGNKVTFPSPPSTSP